MVQLDWLRPMRHPRRPSFGRVQRRPMHVSQTVAELLEQRSLLSAVLTTMPVDDSAVSDDATQFDDSVVDDCADDTIAECSADMNTSGGEWTDATTTDNGEPVKVMFYSLGATGEEPLAASPYFTDSELRDYLLKLAQQQFGGLFGQTIPQYQYGNGGYPWRSIEGDVVYAMDAAPMAGNAVSNSESTSSSRVTSDTNTQVAGVDEADFVETDGRFIYVAQGSGLTILDTADSLSVASELKLSGNVVGEFLSGDRLTVITQSGFGGWYGNPLVRVADVTGSFAPWSRWNPQTTVTIYDVSDRTAPSMVDQTILDGSFRDARAVAGIVYVVLEDSFHLPEPLFTDTPVDDSTVSVEVPVDDGGGAMDGELKMAAMPVRWGWWNSTVISNRTYETFDDYVARVGDQLASLSLPHAFSVDAGGNTTDLGALTSAENIVRPQAFDQQSLLTVLSLDTTQASAGSGVASSASVLTSYGSTIYMTSDALYVATNEYHYDQGSSSSNTRIDRFNISGTDIQWQASGRVPGTLLNQFALDEQHGDLHVATHTWASQWINNDPTAEEIDWSNGAWSIQNDNGVFVLDTEGDTLDQLGSVTGIASGEQLFAVRFIGDTAYLVTFLRTDPLFAIDLSDPTNPTVLGELVIPGFSNYLQSVGDGLLLGIGQEREAGTWNTRLHASLFSVSDGTNLTQIARQFLDESAQWSSSQSQYDHHALLYSAEDGLLVLPVFGSGYDKESDTYHYEQLLEVLRVDASGIQLLGEIHSDQGVFRTVRIDNVLYAISDSSVTAYSLDDFSVVGQADLFVSWPWYEPVEVVFRNDAGSGGVVNNTLGGVVNTLGGVVTPNPQIIVAIPSASMIIAMSSAPSGSGTGSVNILAMAAQYAQNLANDYARATTPDLMSNTGLTPIGQNSRPIELPNLAAEDSSSRDRNESTEASTKASNESDGPSFDEFWNEFTKRLRNGNDPTPMEDADAPKAETPMSADKAASKTEAPNSRSATERQRTTGNAPEMSQRARPVQRGSTPVVTVKAVTKTSAVKSSMPARPIR